MQPILIDGSWQPADASGSFRAIEPTTGKQRPDDFPVSSWSDCDRALTAAVTAAAELRSISGEQIAHFLESYASAIDARADEITTVASAETALPVTPRLREVELPRTTGQLRQAAAAAREGSWQQPVLDTKLNIRSCFAPIGPVVVFGPNNFPLAYNGIAGGDFAAAIAAGNPVIAKSHPLHPGTSRLLAECAVAALSDSGLPRATIQMLYHLGTEDGLRLVSDPRTGATGFTGSRAGGLALKAAADKTGKPIYLEMSSLNPVVLLPGALRERGDALVKEIADSGLAATGQFCTSPNLVFVFAGQQARRFTEQLTGAYAERPAGALLSESTLQNLGQGVADLQQSGAQLLTGGQPANNGSGFRFSNTLLEAHGADFLRADTALQHEVFGNVATVVLCSNPEELQQALTSLTGNLTGSIYSATDGTDDELYTRLAAILRTRVGRLLNDKVPTGVAVSPAMNHGGPFPSTGHPGFTAVGLPRSIVRFTALECYDNVRPQRLPPALRDTAPNPEIWRSIDGVMVRG